MCEMASCLGSFPVRWLGRTCRTWASIPVASLVTLVADIRPMLDVGVEPRQGKFAATYCMHTGMAHCAFVDIYLWTFVDICGHLDRNFAVNCHIPLESIGVIRVNRWRFCETLCFLVARWH